MIVTRIIGGLGNQMFEYAAARALSLRWGGPLKLDISAFETYTLHSYGLSKFKIAESIAAKNEFAIGTSKSIFDSLSRKLHHKVELTLYQEKSLAFEPEFLTLGDNIFLDGYWQSEKYFKDFEHQLRQDFSFKHLPSIKNQELLSMINAEEAVSVHVRRGDYVTNKEVNSVHGTCDIDYYRRAVDYLNTKNSSLPMKFFIFSDDPEWVKENMTFDKSTVFVTHNDATSNFEDMRLMSACKHHIIANSSFSWWGAWLNASQAKIVIAPKQWFKTDTLSADDIVPAAWIRL